ncbi:MAG: FliA/WhiG family RNA polymerase sigma factor [Planctomycetota bacterium]
MPAARTKQPVEVKVSEPKLKLTTDSAEAPANENKQTKAKAPAKRSSKKNAMSADALSSLEPLELKAILDDMPHKELWTLYQQERPQSIRNYFVERYMPLVRYNAERIHVRLPDEVDVEDLVSVGMFGLMDAIDAFDLERGVKFETYCAPRIRGAILDELRSMDWVPRLVRHRTGQVEKIRAQHSMKHGTKPTEEEISKKLGVADEEVKKILRDGSAVSMTSLNKRRYQSDGSREVCEIDVFSDRSQADPLTLIQRTDMKELLTKGLSRAERLIVVLYYYEDMTMKEIGATLDLSESRVSQMHSSILARLRAQMQHRERDLAETAAIQ